MFGDPPYLLSAVAWVTLATYGMANFYDGVLAPNDTIFSTH